MKLLLTIFSADESCYFVGNYGNMMDESVAPSNTPPCNAVYDGSNYYYLPWSSEKPCVCVESYWENISFRLEPLNALLRIIDCVVRPSATLTQKKSPLQRSKISGSYHFKQHAHFQSGFSSRTNFSKSNLKKVFGSRSVKP